VHPCTAVTLPNIGVPHYDGVPHHRVTYPYPTPLTRPVHVSIVTYRGTSLIRKRPPRFPPLFRKRHLQQSDAGRQQQLKGHSFTPGGMVDWRRAEQLQRRASLLSQNCQGSGSQDRLPLEILMGTPTSSVILMTFISVCETNPSIFFAPQNFSRPARKTLPGNPPFFVLHAEKP
jgi:hypothetical protein